MRIRSNDPSSRLLMEHIRPVYLVARCREHVAFGVNRDIGYRRLVSLDDVDGLQSYRVENQYVARRSLRVFAPSTRER